MFSITDESLAHPYAEHERIPVRLLSTMSLGLAKYFASAGLGSRTHRWCLPAYRDSVDGRILHEELLRCASWSVGSWLESRFDRHVDGYNQGERSHIARDLYKIADLTTIDYRRSTSTRSLWSV